MISDLGAVCHPGFDRKWVQPFHRFRSAPLCQISTKTRQLASELLINDKISQPVFSVSHLWSRWRNGRTEHEKCGNICTLKYVTKIKNTNLGYQHFVGNPFDLITEFNRRWVQDADISHWQRIPNFQHIDNEITPGVNVWWQRRPRYSWNAVLLFPGFCQAWSAGGALSFYKIQM